MKSALLNESHGVNGHWLLCHNLSLKGYLQGGEKVHVDSLEPPWKESISILYLFEIPPCTYHTIIDFFSCWRPVIIANVNLDVSPSTLLLFRNNKLCSTRCAIPNGTTTITSKLTLPGIPHISIVYSGHPSVISLQPSPLHPITLLLVPLHLTLAFQMEIRTQIIQPCRFINLAFQQLQVSLEVTTTNYRVKLPK